MHCDEPALVEQSGEDPDGPKLAIPPGEWRAFTGRVKDGLPDLT